MNHQQAFSEEIKNMCATSINRFLETARRHLLGQVAATTEFAPVSEPVHQVN